MISSRRVNQLLAYLCKHMPPDEVERIKQDIERILGFDMERAFALRRAIKERDGITQSLAMAKIE